MTNEPNTPKETAIYEKAMRITEMVIELLPDGQDEQVYQRFMGAMKLTHHAGAIGNFSEEQLTQLRELYAMDVVEFATKLLEKNKADLYAALEEQMKKHRPS